MCGIRVWVCERRCVWLNNWRGPLPPRRAARVVASSKRLNAITYNPSSLPRPRCLNISGRLMRMCPPSHQESGMSVVCVEPPVRRRSGLWAVELLLNMPPNVERWGSIERGTSFCRGVSCYPNRPITMRMGIAEECE